MQGFLSLYLEAMVIESFASFRQQDLLTLTILLPFLPLPFITLIEQMLPGLGQKPQGLCVPQTAGSCRMCIPIWFTSTEGFRTDRGRYGH